MAKRWSVGWECNSNKQIHESSHYLSYFPWVGQSSHANLCSDHWLAPGRSWPCDLPHKYHHHPLQKHQHQMPKCGYSGGNFLPQFVLSLKGSLQSPVTVYSSNLPMRKHLTLPFSGPPFQFAEERGMTCFVAKWMMGTLARLEKKFSINFFSLSPNCSCQANSRTYTHLLQATQFGIIN